MTKIPAFVVPVTNILGEKNKEQLERLLTSIEPYRNNYTTVILWDSCDSFFVEYFQEKFPWINHSIENLGHRLNFTRNANVGLRFSHTELKSGCFLVNQDCILSPQFHKNVELIMEADLSTPSSDSTLMIRDTGFMIQDVGFSTGFTHMPTKERFAFYCPWISYKCMETIGYLDGVFRKTYSDTDYVVRALLAGLTVSTTNVPIFHAGSHIETPPGWQSESGCYTAVDLSEEFRQFAYKWDIDVPAEVLKERGVDKKEKLPIDKYDELMVSSILAQYRFTDDMRIN